MTLPIFKYHPDPVASGSVVQSDTSCDCCGKARGYIYTTPIYAEEDTPNGICPWCIAEGKAHKKLDATFVDSEAFMGDAPEDAIEEITERTPGYSAWQGEQWPVCCEDATAFIEPLGITEIRARYRELEGMVLSHIIYEMGISGGAATRLLGELDREKGPTAYLFRCLTCESYRVHIDRP
jgi:uncharacterized protein